MTRVRGALLAALLCLPPVLALAAPIVVNQSRRSFSVQEVRLHRGETIRFSNVDEFLHHLYVTSPKFNFSSGEQSPGQVIDITFPVEGTFEVRCEIHPKMKLTAIVE